MITHWPSWCSWNLKSGITVAEDGGFRVVQIPPLTDERLDDILGDDFEERVLINMPIDYIHVSACKIPV